MKKVRTHRSEWRLTVEYSSKLYFAYGLDDPRHMDKYIAKKLHKKPMSSGIGLFQGARRDISFLYRSEPEVRRGEKIARKIKAIVGIEVTKEPCYEDI